MHFEPELYSQDLPDLISRFVGIAGWVAWKKRVESLENEYQRSPVLEQFVKERHALELELGRLLRRKRKTARLPKKVETHELIRLVGLIGMTSGVFSRLSNQGKTRLRGMIVDALKTNFSSLEHEMGMAAHLMLRGFDVEFVDLEGKERFDYLVRREGAEIELECKTVSYDLGRKIHRADFNRLAARLWPILWQYVSERRRSRLVTLTLADRLEPNDSNFERIGQLVKSVLWGNLREITVEDVSLRVEDYERAHLPADLESLHAEMEERIGTHQFHLFLVGDSEAVLIFVAHSSRRDQVLTYMHRQLRRASDQFSGKRPAVLCVNIEDIFPHQWDGLREGSGLQAMTSRYLRSPQRSYVHTLAYNSVGVVHRNGSSSTILAPTLYFRNPSHARYDDNSLSIFD